MTALDSFATLRQLSINETTYHYFSLLALKEAGFTEITRLPYTLKILLENLLRHEDGQTVKKSDIHAIFSWLENKKSNQEIAYRPARVLMQDFTGVPAVVDLGAMRDAIAKMGGDPERINPLSPVDLVIDHSIQVDVSGTSAALLQNSHLEMQRNNERYAFLRWGQHAFTNFRVVPPATGICHQVNLEYLAKTVWQSEANGIRYAYPDTLVGTDSHTTMINGLGVLGWGVGGIEAEAAMLGQSISMLIPEVVGVELTGKLREGVTATDLVLTITQQLRALGVVGKFVEFYGLGLAALPVSDRATIANMAPEYGATCGFFPIDQATLDYLRLTGRDEQTLALVEQYAKAQALWHEPLHQPEFTTRLEINLDTIEPSLAGPKRPQDRVTLSALPAKFNSLLSEPNEPIKQQTLNHGDVVIAAITSCTNTSNPSVLLAAGLLAKKALAKGLRVKPWVKTSLAPGSKVVTEYLNASGLQKSLDELGFQTVGYGCTTCIGNSGPLSDSIADAISQHDLVVSAVLSGNRNFEGRIHPQVKANWLASPPLVVAFALAGTTRIDLSKDPLGKDHGGQNIFLSDIWPSNQEIAEALHVVNSQMFKQQYSHVFAGPDAWQAIAIPAGKTYTWQEDSTYIQHPPYFQNMQPDPKSITSIENARLLAILGDSITTDHISPAGSIKADSPAGKYLLNAGIAREDFNSYGARRGNHEVMVRGTFANIRIKNEMVPGIEGGFTKHYPSEAVLSIYDAAMQYQSEQVPLIIIAGKEYGSGSSRDWAAKGPKLQGVRAVIAESFERIHRSNLIGMGILPLEFLAPLNRKTLNLTGSETISIDLTDALAPGALVTARIKRLDGSLQTIQLKSRIDTQNELEYYRHDGILTFVLRKLLKENKTT